MTRPKAWIEVNGEDAPQFLQSQFSGDLRVDIGSAVQGLWLDHRARIHGESIVLKTGDESFIIASLSTPAAGLLEKLEGHVIADEVDFENRTDEVWCVLSLGPAASVENGSTPDGQFLYQNSTYAFDDSLGLEPVAVEIGSEEFCRGILDTFVNQGLEAWSSARWDAWRVRCHRPLIPAEVGLDETPADVGLGRLCSLSKGCYLGQEVVNRQARLERSPRSLFQVLSHDQLAMKSEEHLSLENDEGVVVGSLRLCVSDGSTSIGLAMVKSKYRSGPLLVDGQPSVSLEVVE